MYDQESQAKTFRLLSIADQLRAGGTLKKSDLAQRFHVTDRSIQRDLEDLRCFIAERHRPVRSFTTPRPEATT